MRMVSDSAACTIVADIDIVTTRGEMESGIIAQGDISPAGCVAKERRITVSHVEAAFCVAKECERSVSRVGPACVVKYKRVSSNGRVFGAGRVEQKRRGTDCRIGICVVEGQHSTANSGVEAAGGIQKERAPTKSCISSAGAKRTKRIAALHCREIRIAAVRYRTHCFHAQRGGKVSEQGKKH